MARKSKRDDEEEWRDWGEKFGKRMEKRGKDFSEEMQDFGERFGRRMERRKREWWFGVFGFIGPLVGSILGIIFLAILIWLLKFINLPLGSGFISSVANFLFVNLHWFFAAFLFFGYSDYFSKRFPREFWVVAPIISSIGIIIVIWISTWVLNLINISAQSSLISSLSNFLRANLLPLFIIFLVLGYIIVIIKKLVMNMWRF